MCNKPLKKVCCPFDGDEILNTKATAKTATAASTTTTETTVTVTATTTNITATAVLIEDTDEDELLVDAPPLSQPKLRCYVNEH